MKKNQLVVGLPCSLSGKGDNWRTTAISHSTFAVLVLKLKKPIYLLMCLKH